MQITILCKVVDNFGDIGVVYRLAKQLKKIKPENQINLVVDDLLSFQKICSSVQCDVPFQEVESLNIYNWNASDFCHEAFSADDGALMPVILECFQCGRPDWMERILFEEKLQRTVQIIMIDYLTAEKYAEDFHCLQSLTRSAKVQKVNFMPGFTEKTGGLVIDDAWTNLPEWNSDGPVLVFTYENDWVELAEALADYCIDSGRKVLVAQGRGKKSFMQSFAKVVSNPSTSSRGATNFIEELPYLNQTEWDQMMKGCSALVIRGEESMSRACLSGIPFIWHAYPQSDEYQLVKVRALLERMKPHFDEEDFEIVSKAWLKINGYNEVSLSGLTGQSAQDSDVQIPRSSRGMTPNMYIQFFSSIPRLVPGFCDFAQSLRKNGDLCANLMTFIEKLAII